MTNMNPLIGQHHVSMLTKDAHANVFFYKKILGLRLVKKTVNQDNPTMYHLFYGNKYGAPGTEVSFFEMPNLARTRKGTNSISSISLIVPSDEALTYWQNRLEQFDVSHQGIEMIDNRQSLTFSDPDDLIIHLMSAEKDEGHLPGDPWEIDDIPVKYAILGLGPVVLKVREAHVTNGILEELFGYRRTRSATALGDSDAVVDIFETHTGGLSTELHVKQSNDEENERPGRGSIHHVAMRVATKGDLDAWAQRITDAGYEHTGVIDRYYFHSLYFRDPNNIVYELATDGPGFAIDESDEALGEKLTLPSFLEDRRMEIEAKLHPIETE